jgi:PhoPQ-activated pathogenicity-related protein
MIQAKFGLNWPSALSGFRGEDFFKSLQTDDGRQVMVIAHTGELKRKQSPLTSNHWQQRKRKRLHMVLEIQVLAGDRHKDVGLNQLMESQNISSW